MVDRPFIAAACGFLLAAASACSDSDVSQAAPPGPKAPAAGGTKVRFEPAKSEHLDVAVGEEVTFDLELVGEAPVPWNDVRLSTTCDCLSVEYLGKPSEKRAKVRVTIHGIEEESIEGGITAEVMKDGKEQLLHEHLANLAIRRKPFLMPSDVVIEPTAEGRFDLLLGQAFKPDATLPDSLLQDVGGFDGDKIEPIDMVDLEPKRDLKNTLLTTRIVFVVIAADRKAPFETKVDVEFGAPPVKRTVKVRWPGLK
jgi:hypothetical protein